MWRQEEGQLFRGDSIHTRKGNFSSIAEKAHDRSILVLLVAAMHKLVTSNHMRERERLLICNRSFHISIYARLTIYSGVNYDSTLHIKT